MHMKLSTILGFLSVLLNVITLGPLAHTGLTVNDDQNARAVESFNVNISRKVAIFTWPARLTSRYSDE
jgi:hypothetical protein